MPHLLSLYTPGLIQNVYPGWHLSLHMYKHTHARLAHMGGHVQTNAYQYCQHQLRHNTTGRKEAAADVNTVCRGWGGWLILLVWDGG